MPLLPDDQRQLTAAEGYAALGMYLDADAELEEIDAEMVPRLPFPRAVGSLAGCLAE